MMIEKDIKINEANIHFSEGGRGELVIYMGFL